MMKRFLTLVLCLCMMCMATVALAENEVTYPNGAADFDEEVGVNITAIATDTAVTNAADVYSVEIVWGDMKFAYGYGAGETTATWNPETHEYDVVEKGTDTTATKGWYMLNEVDTVKPSSTAFDLTVDGTNDMVMVFNHSNQPVNAKIVIEEIDDTEVLTATFTKDSGSALVAGSTDTYALEAGVERDPYNATAANVIGKVSIDQESMTSTTELTIAKLNVTISQPAASN